jgi:hypothetical protein
MSAEGNPVHLLHGDHTEEKDRNLRSALGETFYHQTRGAGCVHGNHSEVMNIDFPEEQSKTEESMPSKSGNFKRVCFS